MEGFVSREIELELIDDSPRNPRKSFDEVEMKDLAASIATQGLINPLIVRPVGKRYELIAGHRRKRAVALAGMHSAKCVVRDLTDAEADEMALVDNLQRASVPAMEEAEAFAHLLEAPGATVESVAATLGKASSYVGRRLKLLDAVEGVREALRHGAIEVGHALEIARLSSEQQLRTLDWLEVSDSFSEDDDEDLEEEETSSDGSGEWFTTRRTLAELKNYIAHTTLKVLGNAPFALTDEIPPVACSECPKRSANAQSLFDDLADDTCTDRECFDGKVRAWVRHSCEQAEAGGENLLLLTDGWDDKNGSVIRSRDVRVIEDDCAAKENAIWIDGEHAGFRVVICRDAKCKVHRGTHVSSLSAKQTPEDKQKAREERKKLLAAVKEEKAYRAQLYRDIAKATPSEQACDEFVTRLAAYAISRSDSTKHGVLAEASGIERTAITGWYNHLLEDVLQVRSVGERALLGLLALKGSLLTVHEHEARERKHQRNELEELAEMVGIDWASRRPGANKKPQAKKTAKKKPAKKRVAKKSAARKSRPTKQD